MEITRRSDYACRIIRAAYYADGRYISIAQVSEDEDIPYAFARSIQHELVHAGLLNTVRGAKGGLTLACDPSTTTVYDVLSALDGEPHLSPCSADPTYCDKCGSCQYNRVWCKAEAMMKDYFGSITLDELFGDSECPYYARRSEASASDDEGKAEQAAVADVADGSKDDAPTTAKADVDDSDTATASAAEPDVQTV
jgi:Rrf2 family protein